MARRTHPEPDPRFAGTLFVRGVAAVRQLPEDTGREVAFAGRSNAGKSSVINALVGQKQLARISKQPGRTQQLNYFEVTAHRWLVDLPGYGFAKVDTATRAQWDQLIDRYLRERRSLAGLVLVMDARHPLRPFDLELLAWSAASALPILLLLNKMDKLSRSDIARTTRDVQQQNGSELATVLPVSATRGDNLDQMRDWVAQRLDLTRTGTGAPGSEAPCHPD